MEEINFNIEEKPNKKKRKILIILSIIVFVVGVFGLIVSLCLMDTEKDPLTYENFLQIRNGMDYQDVVEIFDGRQGQLDSSSGYGGYTLSYYSWSNNSGSKCVIVWFENGKVGGKTQYGLN